MSYDYGMMKLRRPIASISELTADHYEPMGTIEELQAIISAVFPDVWWQSDTIDSGIILTASINEEGIWMEISLATWRVIDDLTANTPGPRARSMVEKLCLSAGWTAWNLQTNEISAANVIRQK